MVEIVLLERVENLGQMGDVVRVRPGYARNFLLPQKKAMRATKDNLAIFETRRAHIEAINLQLRADAEKVAEKLAGLTVRILRQAGESGQLYGSVSARDIAEAATQAVADAGLTLTRRQISLDQPIKTLGLHPVKLVLHPEVSVQITANIAQSMDEAVAQETAGGRVLPKRDEDEFEAGADSDPQPIDE